MSAARQELAARVGGARRLVAFTGAGISTESGIPDFRSPGGVWSKMSPIPYADFVADSERRREAWSRVFSGRAGWVGAAPNAGHMALVALYGRGKLASVITQNVDNLHQDSGLPADKVIELHGNASYATCLECERRHELADLRPAFEATGALPACEACGGIVKTATISFGQALKPQVLRRAEQESLDCDLFLVLGSSLVVYPAAALPEIAKRQGAQLVIVNREPTALDPVADLVIYDEIGAVLTDLVATL